MNFYIITFFIFITVAGSTRVLESVRRLDQTEENEYAFLGNYQMKIKSCTPGFHYFKTGILEDGIVTFRLCPSSGDCSGAAGKSCDAGYGEYIVGINTFVSEYMIQIREETQVDDDFDIEQLAYCRQYADSDYYAGPICTADGTNIRMALFTDFFCSTLAEDVAFEDIYAGNTLPNYEGGLLSDSCESCSSVNDNGKAGVNEMCLGLYEHAGKCESTMLYGSDNSFCEIIESFTPQAKQSGVVAIPLVLVEIVGQLLFVIVFVGFTLVVLDYMREEKKEARRRRKSAAEDVDGDSNFELM